MPDPIERTVMRHLKSTVAVASAVAVITLSATSCSSDPANGNTTGTETTTSAPTSSEPTYDDEHAYTEAEKAAKQNIEKDANKAIPDDASWASDAYKAQWAKVVESNTSQNITIKGDRTWSGAKRVKSNPDAAGGWDLTINVCTENTTRAFKDGKDVSLGPDGKPLPTGARKTVELVSFVTPDDGKTWQVDKVQEVKGETCDE